MSNLVFSFPFEASRVRVTQVDGEPWFVGRDVADALGYKWQVNLISHIPGEWKGVERINTPGGAQEPHWFVRRASAGT
ncbi:prophage antirepressor-like protein [Paraburkholderia sp. WSM4175]|uniref:BRO-N domain-containing protein n=1 Tax=Paraburkholderia sp. WSM4175 TaxID=2991072 RepID=UPI003D252CA1